VRVAHDGAEALQVFDERPPTHVLMGLGMLGMGAYEAARRLRAKHPNGITWHDAVRIWPYGEVAPVGP
jgi:CheY-like chemotaxis protein